MCNPLAVLRLEIPTDVMRPVDDSHTSEIRSFCSPPPELMRDFYPNDHPELNTEPFQYTGESSGNPRDKDSFGDGSVEAFAQIISAGDRPAATLEEKLLAKEARQVMDVAEGIFCESIPPKPLTVTELTDIIQHFFPGDARDYIIWIPIVEPWFDQISTGQYRDAVPGNITRFYVDQRENVFTPFRLVPDVIGTGFTWRAGRTVSGTMPAVIVASNHSYQLRYLEKMNKQAQPDYVIGTVAPEDEPGTPGDDRILERDQLTVDERKAAHLLVTAPYEDPLRALPEDWDVGYCVTPIEKRGKFDTRFDAKFDRESDGGLVTFEVESDPVEDGADDDRGVLRPEQGRYDVKGVEPSSRMSAPRIYSWTLTGTTNAVENKLLKRFNSKVTSDDIGNMLRCISKEI